MKALFIGGTGTISMAITRLVAEKEEWELYLLNRGSRVDNLPENVKVIQADINNEEDVVKKLGDMTFDVVGEFIGFNLNRVESDYRIFKDRTKQYIFISSSSAYHKPVEDYRVTEGTTLANPYWQYARNKAACEEYLIDKHRQDHFPVTIVRPSYTYDERAIPWGIQGRAGTYQVVKRMLEGKPVLIQGDGTSLWTMTHNSDFAKGYVGLMGNPHAIGESFHITSDEVLTWNQIYEAMTNVLGVKPNPYHVSSEYLAAVDVHGYGMEGTLLGDKANSIVFDNTKLKNAVPEYTATVRYDQGIRKTLEYILSHKECQVEDPQYDAWCDAIIASLEESKKKVQEACK